MDEGLDKARKLAEGVRFACDRKRDTTRVNPEGNKWAKSIASNCELKISREVTPDLQDSIESLCGRTGVPHDALHAYVYASPEIQASCISTGKDECIIRFSSGLVEILSASEFEFVAGHELGHFLLGHQGLETDTKHATLEDFMFSRHSEISADRFGMIACESLDVAIRALMKSVSGLTGTHLRFDVGRFLAQIREGDNIGFHHDTHPTILVRCRALLWYAMEVRSEESQKVPEARSLLKLDSRIERDLVRYVDGPVRDRIEEAKWNLSMWVALCRLCEKKRFSTEDQKLFADRFGDEALEKMKEFLAHMDSATVEEMLSDRIRSAREEMDCVAPSVTDEVISEADRWARVSRNQEAQ